MLLAIDENYNRFYRSRAGSPNCVRIEIPIANIGTLARRYLDFNFEIMYETILSFSICDEDNPSVAW